jgi:hypothetical protein
VTKQFLIDPNNPTGYAQVIEEYGVNSGAPDNVWSYVSGRDVVAQSDTVTARLAKSATC